MKDLHGVVIPLVTPLTDDDELDVPSLERLVDHLVDAGMDCLYPCGTTAEMAYLADGERRLAVETVVRRVAGRVPVFAQVGAANTAATVALAQHAAACGADGIGVVTPWYFQLSDQALFDFYAEVAASVPADYPVYLYAIPQNAVNDISVDLAERIAAACPNVRGIKYSYPDMTRIQAFMAVRGGDFSVLVGPDHLYTAASAMGGAGTVSGNAMVIPAYYKELAHALEMGDYGRAAKIQHKTNVLNGILCAKNNIACYKAVLKHQGIIATKRMRAPMEELPDADEQALIEALEAHGYPGIDL